MSVHYCRQYHAITKYVRGPKTSKGIGVIDEMTWNYAHIDYQVYSCLIRGNLHKLPFRSSLSSWSVGRQEAAVQDVDYISFLFSTMTGFSSDKLTSLQEVGDDYVLSPSSLTPLSLYCTHLDQFTHHWDVVEVRLPLSRNYFKPHRLSSGCRFQSEMLRMNLDEPESKS